MKKIKISFMLFAICLLGSISIWASNGEPTGPSLPCCLSMEWDQKTGGPTGNASVETFYPHIMDCSGDCPRTGPGGW